MIKKLLMCILICILEALAGHSLASESTECRKVLEDIIECDDGYYKIISPKKFEAPTYKGLDYVKNPSADTGGAGEPNTPACSGNWCGGNGDH